MAFDKHMNIVLGDVEETRISRPAGKKSEGKGEEVVEEKRALGLVMVRGDMVISMKPLAPPAAKPRIKKPANGAPVPSAATTGTP